MAKPNERCRMVVRQWEILRLLEERPATVDELAAAVGDGGVTVRTVYRDLEALQAAQFPLFSARAEDEIVRWHLMTKGVTPARRAA